MLLKDELFRLLNYKYFNDLPPLPNRTPEVFMRSPSQISKNTAASQTNFETPMGFSLLEILSAEDV